MQPQQPCDNAGSTRALGCLLGEGARKQRGGINAIGGWVMREAMHAREMVFFSTHHACYYAQVLGIKKPKSKIRRCSGIGKFCSPAAASPKLMQGNKFKPLCCMIAVGGGGGQEGAPPLLKLIFLFLGFVFGSAGSAGKKK